MRTDSDPFGLCNLAVFDRVTGGGAQVCDPIIAFCSGGNIVGCGVVVEEVRRRNLDSPGVEVAVQFADLGVHGLGLARHGLDHGVAVEGVEVRARLGEEGRHNTG